MAFTQKELRVTTCAPAAHDSFSDADNAPANDFAVKLAASTTYIPSVLKTAAADEPVYGKFQNYQDNGETSTSAVGNRRVGVITGGIVRFKVATADAASSPGDLGKGIVGGSVAGQVKAGGTAGLGRGQIVGIADAGETLWVDLDADAIA